MRRLCIAICSTVILLTCSSAAKADEGEVGKKKDADHSLAEKLLRNDVVATVNKEEIRGHNVISLILKRSGDATITAVVNGLVDRALLKQEATRKKITVTIEEVDKELNRRAALSGGSKKMLSELRRMGIPISMYRENVFIGLLVRAVLGDTISVDDDEIEHEFEGIYGERIQVRHILVQTEKEARNIQKKLKEGADFGSIARQVSLDKASTTRGGLLDPLPRGVMVGPFEQAAFKLKEGEISDPVRTSYGYHIIKMVDRIQADEVSLDEVRDTLRLNVLDRKAMQELEPLLQRLRSEAEIDKGFEAK